MTQTCRSTTFGQFVTATILQLSSGRLARTVAPLRSISYRMVTAICAGADDVDTGDAALMGSWAAVRTPAQQHRDGAGRRLRRCRHPRRRAPSGATCKLHGRPFCIHLDRALPRPKKLALALPFAFFRARENPLARRAGRRAAFGLGSYDSPAWGLLQQFAGNFVEAQ